MSDKPSKEAVERVDVADAWQPIATAPRDGTPILLYLSAVHSHSRVHVGWFLPNVKAGVIAGLFGYDVPAQPLYWLPLTVLPDPPKEER